MGVSPCNSQTCQEVNFISGDEIDIEVNLAKLHGENFECGFCENTANDLETLDTHLGIYEIYKCKICGEQILKLTNIKTHVK